MNKVRMILKKYRPSKWMCLFYLLIPIFICFLKNSDMNNDSYFLINHGRFILEHGIPFVEPFTIHTGFAFVMQQWLSSLIFALLYNVAGNLSLDLFVTFISVLIVLVTYKLTMLVSNKNFYLSVLFTFVTTFLLSFFFLTGRPQIFTYLILLSLLYCLESYIRKKDWRYLIVLPILSLLQINLHASMWGMLFCFLLPYFVASKKMKIFCLQSDGYPLKPILLALLLMLAAGFLNPYGLRAITYVFTSYGNPYINIIVNEMKRPNIKELYGAIIYATIFLVLFLYSKGRGKTIKIRYFCLFCGTVFLTLTANRNYALFLLIAFFPLTEVLTGDKAETPPPYPLRFSLTNVFLISIFFLYLTGFTYFANQFSLKNRLYGVVRYLDQHSTKDTEILYTSYDDGSFLEFHGYRPYIDARAEVFVKANNHKKDVFKEYYQLQYEMLDAEKFLKRYPFTHLIVRKEDRLYKVLAKNKAYQLVYQDKIYKIYSPKT